ncbi:hypothetical protein PSHT_01867 [Puccinia striiformis]|uniref:Uncharacterized protein n=1 Tax=Puccinia striiformis TaxID=27350 RepID=A0A2S4WJD7_9BASI|nr:hypothetical protein PSHT_01867 [Puccinia striiformis]
MKKAPPPPCTSSPTDPPVESPPPVSDIEVPKSQSDIITGTPSVLQAPAENQLVKQPTNVGNNSDQPSKKHKQTSNIWDHFVKKGTGTANPKKLVGSAVAFLFSFLFLNHTRLNSEPEVGLSRPKKMAGIQWCNSRVAIFKNEETGSGAHPMWHVLSLYNCAVVQAHR